MNMIIECVDDGGLCYSIWCRSAKEVCRRCDGEGKHVNPSIDGNGISPEEFAEDPDFEEAYFSGQYDVQCEECRGEKVIRVPLLRWLPQDVQDDYRRLQDEKNQADADDQAERRYFARFER